MSSSLALEWPSYMGTGSHSVFPSAGLATKWKNQQENGCVFNFPGGPAVKNSLSKAGDMGLIPGRKTKIPRAAGQLSLHAATRESMHPNERSCMLQLNIPSTCSLEDCPHIQAITPV